MNWNPEGVKRELIVVMVVVAVVAVVAVVVSVVVVVEREGGREYSMVATDASASVSITNTPNSTFLESTIRTLSARFH